MIKSRPAKGSPRKQGLEDITVAKLTFCYERHIKNRNKNRGERCSSTVSSRNLIKGLFKLLGIYLGVEMLGHMVILYLTFFFFF